MFRKLLLVALIGAGCREELIAGPVDLSRGGDMAIDPDADLSMMQMMTSTTPHDIDTGAVAEGTLVKLTGMLIMSPVKRRQSNSTGFCEYRVQIQDPMCTMPPCGLQLYTRGVKLALDASTTDCPYHDQSSTPFAPINGDYGQVVDVTGSVRAFTDTMGSVVAHSITVDTLTVAPKQPLPMPFAVTDENPSRFTIHTGSGWDDYEGTYIKLSPAGGGKFTIGTVDAFGDFTVTPGNAQMSTDFYFGPKDGGDFPVMGTQYSTIAGVVVNDFGGVINPILTNDYQP
jgi:hypothetical protein